MTVDGRRLLVHAGLVLALLGTVGSAAVVCFFASLAFFGEPLGRIDYLHQALALGIATLLLVAALVPMQALAAATWVRVLAVVLATLTGLGVVLSMVNMGSAPRGGGGEPWWWAVQLFVVLPSTWPVFALLMAGPFLRGRSSRSPR